MYSLFMVDGGYFLGSWIISQSDTSQHNNIVSSFLETEYYAAAGCVYCCPWYDGNGTVSCSPRMAAPSAGTPRSSSPEAPVQNWLSSHQWEVVFVRWLVTDVCNHPDQQIVSPDIISTSSCLELVIHLLDEKSGFSIYFTTIITSDLT